MDMLRRVVAVFLVGIFMVTAAHFILSPFYPDSLDAGRLWDILNPFMAVAMVAVLVAHWVRKHKLDSGGQDGAMTREYIEGQPVVLCSRPADGVVLLELVRCHHGWRGAAGTDEPDHLGVHRSAVHRPDGDHRLLPLAHHFPPMSVGEG